MLSLCLLATSARSDVRVFVEEVNGQAWLRYECTAGEIVRAFALDVSVDQGQIVGVSDFFVGESTAQAQGYGFFPASFRDHITLEQGGTVDWEISGYTPLASVADNPNDTLPGLGSSGVTLELGGLWDSTVTGAIPGPTGTLCALQLSEGATVSVSANASRGGVVSVEPDRILATSFSGAFVQPPEITGLSLSESEMRIRFIGGELETAPTLEGPWSATGDASGEYIAVLGAEGKRFYRVRSP